MSSIHCHCWKVNSDEGRDWADFLLAAAKKADASASYSSALQYVIAAEVLVGMEQPIAASESTALRSEPAAVTARSNQWLNHYSFTFDLTFLRAKLEYLNKNYEVCERVCEDALNFVNGLLDRCKAL